MVDISIQIEPIYPGPGHKTGNSEMRYRVVHDKTELGIWHDPECSAARKLLELGQAERYDVLRSYRGSTPCMKGDIGWFADHMVREDDAYNSGTPSFVKWRPSPFSKTNQ